MFGKFDYSDITILNQYAKGIIYSAISKKTQSLKSIKNKETVVAIMPLFYEIMHEYENEIKRNTFQDIQKQNEIMKKIQNFGKKVFVKQSWDSIGVSPELFDLSYKLTSKNKHVQVTWTEIRKDKICGYSVCFCFSNNYTNIFIVVSVHHRLLN